MNIKVICFGHLAIFHSGGQSLELPNGTAVGDLPDILGFSRQDAAMYFVGEQRVADNYVISSGDVVKIFPPITGG